MKLPAFLRSLLPSRSMPTPVLRGPFRGARIYLRPHENLRKIFGFYEHELNSWLARVLPRVDTVLDVGANDGYFTFGCAAALRRLGREARIIAFEPQAGHCAQLEASRAHQPMHRQVEIIVQPGLVGQEVGPGQTSLDAILNDPKLSLSGRRALIKIDVEGAEREVVAGAEKWLDRSNYFLIEVHREDFLDPLRKRFADAGLALELINQSPLPILGREQRTTSNCWLVSVLP